MVVRAVEAVARICSTTITKRKGRVSADSGIRMNKKVERFGFRPKRAIVDG